VVRGAQDGGAGGAWVRRGLAVVSGPRYIRIWPGMSAGPAMSVSSVAVENSPHYVCIYLRGPLDTL
jgi:hypothetical protein